MMPLIVAGTAARASTMLAAATATRANSVMRLRTGECDALAVSNCIFPFMFRNPPMSDENEPRRRIYSTAMTNRTLVEKLATSCDGAFTLR
jgi:hypothetical protein